MTEQDTDRISQREVDATEVEAMLNPSPRSAREVNIYEQGYADGCLGRKSLRIRAGFDQTSKGIVSGSWTVEGTGCSRAEVLAELDALSAEVLARVKEMNGDGVF